MSFPGSDASVAEAADFDAAILALLRSRGGQISSKKLAAELNISVHDVEDTLDILAAAGEILCRPDGGGMIAWATPIRTSAVSAPPLEANPRPAPTPFAPPTAVTKTSDNVIRFPGPRR